MYIGSKKKKKRAHVIQMPRHILSNKNIVSEITDIFMPEKHNHATKEWLNLIVGSMFRSILCRERNKAQVKHSTFLQSYNGFSTYIVQCSHFTIISLVYVIHLSVIHMPKVCVHVYAYI